MDTRRSYNLVEQILNFALTWLKPGGNFTVKVFQGGDETEIFDRMKVGVQTGKEAEAQGCEKGVDGVLPDRSGQERTVSTEDKSTAKGRPNRQD